MMLGHGIRDQDKYDVPAGGSQIDGSSQWQKSISLSAL